jgi:hypothetical protein
MTDIVFQHISKKVDQYVSHLGDALEVEDQDVHILYGRHFYPGNGLYHSDHPIDPEESYDEWINPELPNEISMDKDVSQKEGVHLNIVGEVEDSLFYDVVDQDEDTVAEAIFEQNEDGVEIFVNFLASPKNRLKKQVVQKLTREALSLDYQWLNMRMSYHDQTIGGFHIQRGSSH